MQFITRAFLILASLAYCHAVSVGFKTIYRENSVLIIGEVSNTASSVQISNILNQLQVLKILYTKHQNKMAIHFTIGKRMKVSRRLENSEGLSLYDVQSSQFTDFLRSKVSSAAIIFYRRPSLLIKSSKIIPDEIEIILDDTIIFDINEVFPENMEVSHSSHHPHSPIIEYDDIDETGQSVDSGLLRRRSKSRKCFVNCCCSIS